MFLRCWRRRRDIVLGVGLHTDEAETFKKLLLLLLVWLVVEVWKEDEMSSLVAEMWKEDEISSLVVLSQSKSSQEDVRVTEIFSVSAQSFAKSGDWLSNLVKVDLRLLSRVKGLQF